MHYIKIKKYKRWRRCWWWWWWRRLWRSFV